MISADTITNEQIRELRSFRLVETQGDLDEIVLICDDALSCHSLVERNEARARCAEILNERAKAGCK